MSDLRTYLDEKIIPRIKGDGGWADITELTDDHIKFTVQGECSKCNITSKCMDWVSAQIKQDLGKDVTIEFTRKKPFFWDVKN